MRPPPRCCAARHVSGQLRAVAAFSAFQQSVVGLHLQLPASCVQRVCVHALFARLSHRCRPRCTAPPGSPPNGYASRSYSLYLLAEDDLPTYKGWTSVCSTPRYDQSPPPGPCAPVTVVPCNNTPPAAEANNRQALPYAPWDVVAGGAAPPPPPAGRPLSSPLTVSDPTPIAFASADLSSVGGGGERALIFGFALSRPGLVRYTLVRNEVEVLGRGMLPVYEAGTAHNVSLSRDCSGAQLVPGTAYGVWFNATDVYGAATPLRILSQTL